MKKEETLLLKIQGDNKNLKVILKESTDLLNTLTKSVHKANEEIALTGKNLTPATESLKKFLSVADSKAINIKIDHSKVDTVIKKFELMLGLLSNIQKNSKISLDMSGVEGIDKAIKAMKSLSNIKKPEANVRNSVLDRVLSIFSKDSKNIPTEIKIKGLEKLEIYNKSLSEMIKKLEDLKQLGKGINIDLKGLESLTNLLIEFEKLEAKTKKLQEEIDKLKKSMDRPVANPVEPANKGIEDALPKMGMWLVALDLMASAAKVALREIGQAFIALSDDILKFEQEVYQSRTVLQDGLGDFQKTANSIIDSAREIGASANKAAGGIQTVFAAGINEAKDALYGYQIAQMSAMATQSDMNDLINFGVLANKNYSSTVQDWPTLFNKISVAATQSKLDIADFAKQGGTIASGFTAANISLDESLSLVSSFGNYLRNASEATVAATNMVKKIIQPTKEMKGVIKEINDETAGIGQKLIFSPSGLKGIDGTLEGFLRNFNTKVEAYAKKNASTVQDVLARMFKEIRANRGLQVAYSSIMSGEFERIKKEVQNDTTFLQRAFEESTKSILNRWEILTNNISSDFKKIFVAVQPSLHQFLDFVEGSISQVIEFFRELGAEFVWLADSQIWEDTKSMFSGLGTVISFLLTLIGDLIKVLASGLNAVLKFIEGVQSLFSDLRNFIGTFWSDLTENGIKNIFTYFDSQISAFKQKSEEFFDQVWKFFTNIGKVGKCDYFDDKEANNISSKVGKNMPSGQKKNFNPYQALAEYGNRGVEMIETAKEIGDDMLTVEDEINKIRLSEMEYATKDIIKKHEERTDKIKEALEDEKSMLESLQKSFDKVREDGVPTDKNELKKYTTLAGALANQKRKLKDIETQANQDIIKANELRDLQLEQLRKKKEDEEKTAGEKLKNNEIERIKNEYETNLKRYEDDKNKLIEAETEKGTSKEAIALKTNSFLTKIQNLQSETSKKLLKYDLKEYQDFKEKSSETAETIQINISNFEKQSLEDRLKFKKEKFSEENEELNFNAEFYKVSEEHKLIRQKEINEKRLKDINNFLSNDKELQKEKYKETREALLKEQKEISNKNRLIDQKNGELKIKKEIELERMGLNQKKSILDFEEQYRLDSGKNILARKKQLIQDEIDLAKKELNAIPESDWQAKGLKRGEIFGLENITKPGIDQAEIQLARQLENQKHQEKLDNINRESELNKINTYQALDLEKKANLERLEILNDRLSKETNEIEKENLKREKNALEHANKLIDINKTNEMVNDLSKINNAFSNIAKTFTESSSEMMKGIGSIIQPLSEVGDKILDITKKASRGDIVGLTVEGAQEGARGLSALIGGYDNLYKVLNKTEKTQQDINEATLENLKAIPLLGEAVYKLARVVTDSIGHTLPESVKKARKEIQELLNQIGAYENERNIISTEQKIQLLKKERDEQLKTLDIVALGGLGFLVQYMKIWNEYSQKIDTAQKEIQNAENEALWENKLAKISAQEETFDNKMALIDLEEKRAIEAAKSEYKSEKELNLRIDTIKLQSKKKRKDLAKEQETKLLDKKQEMYEKELDMIDKIYGKHKEKLADEIQDFQDKIKDLTQQIKDVENEFYDNRNRESDKTRQRYQAFSSALSSRKSELAPSFFRANQLEMDTKASLASSQAQTEFEQTGNFTQYQSRMAKIALDKFAYMQKRLSDTTDPQERADIEEKLLSLRQEYYNYAFDKEKEAMEEKKRQLEEEKRQNEEKLKIKKAEIAKVKKAEIAAIDQVNKAYKQSGDIWLSTMKSRTDTWMNYAKTQAKDIFSEPKQEIEKLFAEFEKVKTKVKEELSGKSSSTSVGVGNAITSPSSLGSKMGSLLGNSVLDPDVEKANIIRAIAKNNPGFSEQYFFEKYLWFPLETMRDLARQQMIKGYYKNGTPFVPEDGTYYLHQGERVLTEKQNREFSNAGGGISVVFYNSISGVKLDSSAEIQGAMDRLQSNMTRQLQKEVNSSKSL